ncbi:MAG TPA: tRNA uridine-5-carboxymethylaminomethyl(34) synthesis GTPase MnmE [Clostridiaceae bacterium]|nr:tRNA uridine-5-carboxymethylaminomethyl(34) synthesis GTPase MnmE [Clostridiaceae bacterium]
MYKVDTIAAISTAIGAAGIGIVRISGPDSFEIASKIFKGRKPFEKLKDHTINFGRIVDPATGEMLDDVLVSKMYGPKTYTGEDIVEINCHGGTVMVNRILELVLRIGARLAEPGEFTKRAFLNGKIDLSQAEAVIDIINAKTSESSKVAFAQLEGKLSEKIRSARKSLIDLIAHIEVTLDYPEYDIEKITEEMVQKSLMEINGMLGRIVKDFERGRIIREGINAVIVGRPNVGKSSLLNELIGKSKAIVTDIPGTTRDILEEYVNIHGIPVRITDTAGIRETEDLVEKIGVEKAKKAIDEADLAILMIDGSKGLTDEDKDIIQQLAEKKVIVLINKVDISDNAKIEEMENELKAFKPVRTSMVDGEGIEELEKEIARLFLQGEVVGSDEILITNVRHKKLIDDAQGSINRALEALDTGMPIDCASIDIKDAAEYLGQITGESVSEDVMHSIFSRFCIGK